MDNCNALGYVRGETFPRTGKELPHERSVGLQSLDLFDGSTGPGGGRPLPDVKNQAWLYKILTWHPFLLSGRYA